MKLSVVIPCYNEEKVLPETIRVMAEKYKSLMERELISTESRVLFVLHHGMYTLHASLCRRQLARNPGFEDTLTG